jgi:hypothetical protein
VAPAFERFDAAPAAVACLAIVAAVVVDRPMDS